MPNFKPKTNKKIIVDKKSTITVDTKHQQILNTIEIQEKMIPSLKEKKQVLLKQLKQRDFQNVEEQLVIQDTLQELSEQLRDIKHKKKNYL